MPSKKRATKSKSRRPKPVDPDTYYEIREIKDERTNEKTGAKEYLIVWANDPDTGKAFADSWEPKENLTLTALDEWEKVANEKRRKEAAASSSLTEDDDLHVFARRRGTHRPRVSDDSSSPGADDRPAKRPKLDTNQPVYREPSLVSGGTASSEDSRDWEAASSLLGLGRDGELVVAVPKVERDREDYWSVQLSDGTGGFTSQSISAQEAEDSQRTIPDSQDPSSNFRSLQTTQAEAHEGPDLIDTGLDSTKGPSHTSPTAGATNLEGVESRHNAEERSTHSLELAEPEQTVSASEASHQGSQLEGILLNASRPAITESPALDAVALHSNFEASSQPPPPLFPIITSQSIVIAPSEKHSSASDIPSHQLDDLESRESPQNAIENTLTPSDRQFSNLLQGDGAVEHRQKPVESSLSPLFRSQYFDLEISSSTQQSAAPLVASQEASPDAEAHVNFISQAFSNLAPSISASASQESNQAAQQLPLIFSSAAGYLRSQANGALSLISETSLRLRSERTSSVNHTAPVAGSGPQSSYPSGLVPLSARMENLASSAPMSAVETLRQIQQDALRSASAQPHSPATPATPAHNDDQPAETVAPNEVTTAAPSALVVQSSAELLHPEVFEESVSGASKQTLSPTVMIEGLDVSNTEEPGQGTVAPADITRVISMNEVVMETDEPEPSLDLESHDLVTPHTGETTTSDGIDHEDEAGPATIPPSEPEDRLFTVTLPFAANIRQQYMTIIDRFSRSMEEFSEFFSREIFTEPDAELVAVLRDMFAKLYDICDYPTFPDGLPFDKMSRQERKHHAVSTNPKFSFALEFLDALKDIGLSILVVVRSVKLHNFLEDVLRTEGFKFKGHKMESYNPGQCPLAVHVVLATEEFPAEVHDYDVVIGFDHAFKASSVAKALSEADVDDRSSPLVLHLVVATSIEHIDLEVPSAVDDLHHLNARCIALFQATEYIANPRLAREPYELAQMFVEQLKQPDPDFVYSPDPLPSEIVDIYQSKTQAWTQGAVDELIGSIRKRGRDETDGEETVDDLPKRLRMYSPNAAAVDSDQVKIPERVLELIAKFRAKDVESSRVMVPVKLLEDLLDTMNEQQRKVDDALSEEDTRRKIIQRQEAHVKSFEKTFRRIQTQFEGALKDRNLFETERDAAQGEAAALKKAAVTAKSELTKYKEKVAELEGKLAAAPQSDDSTASVAATSGNSADGQGKIEQLTKKLEAMGREMEFVRSEYQNASHTAAEMALEKRELEESVAELSRKASENVRHVQDVQTQNTVKEILRRNEELMSRIRYQEEQIEELQTTLRSARNGRRETRQSSVPRSPRLGMMSPRPGGAALGGVLGVGMGIPGGGPRATTGSGGGGSASRGTSPAPLTPHMDMTAAPAGMQFFQPPGGNARWNHLRE